MITPQQTLHFWRLLPDPRHGDHEKQLKNSSTQFTMPVPTRRDTGSLVLASGLWTRH